MLAAISPILSHSAVNNVFNGVPENWSMLVPRGMADRRPSMCRSQFCKALDLSDLTVMCTAARSKDSGGQGARVCSRPGFSLCRKARPESAEGKPTGGVD